MQPKQTNEDPFPNRATLLEVINELTRRLEQARGIAMLLEAECSRCWGPIHKEALEQVRLGAFYSEGWDDDVEG